MRECPVLPRLELQPPSRRLHPPQAALLPTAIPVELRERKLLISRQGARLPDPVPLPGTFTKPPRPEGSWCCRVLETSAQPHHVVLVFREQLSPRQALNPRVRTRERRPASENPAYEKTPTLLVARDYKCRDLAGK